MVFTARSIVVNAIFPRIMFYPLFTVFTVYLHIIYYNTRS
nr:MAG TPA: hypothetical protein [Caudoviricetes sp.]